MASVHGFRCRAIVVDYLDALLDCTQTETHRLKVVGAFGRFDSEDCWCDPSFFAGPHPSPRGIVQV